MYGVKYYGVHLSDTFQYLGLCNSVRFVNLKKIQMKIFIILKKTYEYVFATCSFLR